MTKFIFVTGGVMSGLGKGITASSIGLIMKSAGYDVTAIKIDPYLNYDAGTMNPYEHGEVFVLQDGGEVDLDLGNYERFLDTNLSFEQNITTGKVYKSVIEKEREGEYLGSTVQVIPHITDEICERMRKVTEDNEIAIVEVGGTVGDIEGMPFYESIRQMHLNRPEDTMFVHVTLVPELEVVEEQKTKPTQHSVKELRSIGIEPDLIVTRSKRPLEEEPTQKIALYSNLNKNAVFSAYDVENTYEVPFLLENQGIHKRVSEEINLEKKQPDLKEWQEMVEKYKNLSKEVTIGIAGKYVELEDAYNSIIEALKHSSVKNDTKVNIKWINTEKVEKTENPEKKFSNINGLIVPGGFGSRGTEGKIQAIKYARENNLPFLGICYGFQLMIVEFARNVLGYEDAHTAEVDPDSEHNVIDLLPTQEGIEAKGGTMRLGSSEVNIKKGTMAEELYESNECSGRHRHRYEVNPKYVKEIEEKGLKFTGVSKEDDRRMEIGEIENKHYFIGTQYHPELTSRPLNPEPVFYGLVRASKENKESK